MSEKAVLKEWLIEALEENDGEATIVEACKTVWENHKEDLKEKGDLFYTWQYDIRWAAQKLREDGKAGLDQKGQKSLWTLKR